MVYRKSVIYLVLSLHGQIIHLPEEMITRWPKEKAVQHALALPYPTWTQITPHGQKLCSCEM